MRTERKPLTKWQVHRENEIYEILNFGKSTYALGNPTVLAHPRPGLAICPRKAITPFLNRHTATIVGAQGFLAFPIRHIGLGLCRSKTAESFLASQSLVTWSADVVADDWFRHISAQTIVQRAMGRLEAKGRGILLLRDIHPATAMALPTLLKELKARGFQVVQVVPAGDRPKSVPELMASPATERGAWPTVLTSVPSVDHALTTRRDHRIKQHSVSKRRPAVAVSAEKYSTGSARNWQTRQF